MYLKSNCPGCGRLIFVMDITYDNIVCSMCEMPIKIECKTRIDEYGVERDYLTFVKKE